MIRQKVFIVRNARDLADRFKNGVGRDGPACLNASQYNKKNTGSKLTRIAANAIELGETRVSPQIFAQVRSVLKFPSLVTDVGPLRMA